MNNKHINNSSRPILNDKAPYDLSRASCSIQLANATLVFSSKTCLGVTSKTGGAIGGATGGAIGGQTGGHINLTKRQEEILALIKVDNKISRKSISEKLSINESAVIKHLNKLKEKGALKRIGGTRGHWEVINNG